MVNNDNNLFFNGLKKPSKIKKKDHKFFFKISKDYPFFNPAHIINLVIAKNHNSIIYEKNLKKFSLRFLDRVHLFKILKNEILLNEKSSKEIINDLNKNVHKNNLSFLQWLSKTKDTETLQLRKNFKVDFEIIDELKYKRKNIKFEINKEDYMTETLAKMYVKQNKLKEALKAYKILSLKYPEKISLFANQIDFIKNKLKNE